jgi:hypothetical protein
MDEQLLEPSPPAEIALRDDGALIIASFDGTSATCRAGAVIFSDAVTVEGGTPGSARCLFWSVVMGN